MKMAMRFPSFSIGLVMAGWAGCIGFGLTGCGARVAAEDEGSAGQGNGAVTSEISLGKVGALAKPGAINLSKLVITLVSGTKLPDTVRDTSSISGNTQIMVTKTYSLKPLRTWTMTAKTLDSRDSVVHQGGTAPFLVETGDTVGVSLNLTSRFSMYEARFNDLPDSVASTVAGTTKEAIRFKRVVMKVDGTTRADSATSGYFTKGQIVKIFFDYITPGSHNVVLEAHGELNSYSGILYSGNSTFLVSAGADDTKAITLGWVGPTTGTGRLTVTIGKVGKIVINGTLPGTVFN